MGDIKSIPDSMTEFIRSILGLEDDCVYQLFLHSAVSAFSQTPFEVNHNLLLGGCVYFACLAVCGERRLACLSAFWSRFR